MQELGGEESYYVTRSRLEGFRDACQQFRLPWKEQLVFMNLGTTARVAEAIKESVRLRADCILCMDDFLCNLALIQLRERKIRVPEDIKIACFYDGLSGTAAPAFWRTGAKPCPARLSDYFARLNQLTIESKRPISAVSFCPKRTTGCAQSTLFYHRR